jgi:hypothetical protein
MTLAEVKAGVNRTFIVKVSLTIINYHCKNILKEHATDVEDEEQ